MAPSRLPESGVRRKRVVPRSTTFRRFPRFSDSTGHSQFNPFSRLSQPTCQLLTLLFVAFYGERPPYRPFSVPGASRRRGRYKFTFVKTGKRDIRSFIVHEEAENFSRGRGTKINGRARRQIFRSGPEVNFN